MITRPRREKEGREEEEKEGRERERREGKGNNKYKLYVWVTLEEVLRLYKIYINRFTKNEDKRQSFCQKKEY